MPWDNEPLPAVSFPDVQSLLDFRHELMGDLPSRFAAGLPSADPGFRREGNEAVLTGPVQKKDAFVPSAEELLRARGLSPEDWEVQRSVVNEWETTAMVHGEPVVSTNHQLKLFLRALKQAPVVLCLPARPDGPHYVASKKTRHAASGGQLVAILSDQHCPAQDQRLHELTCEWINFNNPTHVVVPGDFCDFSGISAHPKQPKTDNTVQQCIEAGYKVARDYTDAAPLARRTMFGGNHDERLSRLVIDKAAQLYGVRRADTQEEVLAVPYLLRLDELGFEWLSAEDGLDYPMQRLRLEPADLVVLHGNQVKPKSGDSALAHVERYGCSVIIGHVHRQGIAYRTMYNSFGKPKVHTAIEAGTMAELKHGQHYAPAANWQNGFATVHIDPDGYFSADNAKFVDGRLLWQSQSFS